MPEENKTKSTPGRNGSGRSSDRQSTTTTMSSTRQLLDELDALMEKMLSLPVEDSDQTAASYMDDTSNDSGGPSFKDSQVSDGSVAEEDFAENDSSSLPSRAEPHPSKQVVPSYHYEEPDEEKPAEPFGHPNIPQAATNYPNATPDVRPPSSPATPSPGVLPEVQPKRFGMPQPFDSPGIASDPNQPTASTEPQSVLDRAKAEREPATSVFLWPVRLLNVAFDGLTHLLGPLGSGLRTPVGRTILGWLGLAMLVAAGIWQLFLWSGWNAF